MRIRRWFRPPHYVLHLFLVMSGSMAGALGWLGWQLVEQDRALERQRIRERLEAAADLATAALVRSIADSDGQLAALAAAPEAQLAAALNAAARDLDRDAALVVLLPDAVDAYPAGRLPYLPVVAHTEPPPDVFARGEALEFQQRDLAAAAAEFRRLATSADPHHRAGALLRLARTLRKSRQMVAALEVFREMDTLGPVDIQGLPADLLARHGRCAVFEELGRRDELVGEARSLEADLLSGRWRLTRAAYRFYTSETSRWLRGAAGGESGDGAGAQALADALEVFWSDWQRREAGSGGRRSLRVHDRPVLALWRGDEMRTVLLLAGPDHVERQWMAAAQPLLARQGASLALTDLEGRHVRGAALPAPYQVVRSTTETGLPWALHVLGPDAATAAGMPPWRRLGLTALASVGLFVLVGSALIARAVTRELEAARLQNEFVAAVSHEFRTPLASMLQLSELLVDDRVPGEARRREYYQRLHRESDRLHRLVENLLDFGRLEAGAREYRFEELDPAALVRRIGADFAQKLADAGHRIELTVSPQLPSIRADREAIGLALWNLLDNAVKYSPGCSTVWLEADRERRHVAIRVRDRGVGIARAEQRQIFKKFVRATGAQVAAVKGTGLGLAIVHHILAAHDGRVRVESEPGRGSTFTMLLPTRQAGAAGELVSAVRRALGRMRPASARLPSGSKD